MDAEQNKNGEATPDHPIEEGKGQALDASPSPPADIPTILTPQSTETADVPKDSESSSRRKDNNTATSDGAHSSATALSVPQPKGGRSGSSTSSKRKKTGLMSRLMAALIPCAGPTTRGHDVEMLDGTPPPSATPLMKEVAPPSTATLTQQTPPPPTSQAPAKESNGKPVPAPLSVPLTIDIDMDDLPLTTTPTSAEPLVSTDEFEVVVTPPASTHLLPPEETDGVTSGAVQPPGSTRIHTPTTSGDITVPNTASTTTSTGGEESDGTSYTDDEGEDGRGAVAEPEDDEERLIRQGGAGIPIGPDGQPKPLLPPIAPHHKGRKCLVLDLDETLVHSSFKAVQQADFIIPVEIEYHWQHFHVLKRPGVVNFLKEMGEIYEVVVYTASLSKYADPVLDKLDIYHAVTHRLYRESCYSHKGNYVKDLSQLGRPIGDTIILDNSPASYIFHPNNAVPVSSWFNDPHDTELVDLVPFLADLTEVDDVRGILDGGI